MPQFVYAFGELLWLPQFWIVLITLAGTVTMGFVRYRNHVVIPDMERLASEISGLRATESNLHSEKSSLAAQITGFKNQDLLNEQTKDDLRREIATLADSQQANSITIQNQRKQIDSQSASLEALTKANEQHALHVAALEKDRLFSEAKLEKWEQIRARLISSADDLWSLKETKPPHDFERRLRQLRTQIITVGNLKGGVGKSTIAANLAAYLDHGRGGRVLLIDLDYQGTLTGLLCGAASVDDSSNLIANILGGSGSIQTIKDCGKQFPDLLKRTRLVTASFGLAATENQELVRWLFDEEADDVRYRLAEALLDPWVEENFDYVVLDTPPRLSLAMINAICASHVYFTPTILDGASVGAASRFVSAVKTLSQEQFLNRDLKFGGVIPNLLNDINLTDVEKDARAKLAESLKQLDYTSHIFEDGVRHSRKLNSAAGERILYTRDKLFQEGTMDKIGREIDARLPLDPASSTAA